jgi:phosphoglycolate phosphatase
MKSPLPRAVLFDWDNTLVDSWPTIHAALHTTFEHMGHEPWPFETVKTRIGRSARDAFPPIFGDRWEEAAQFYRASFRAIHLQNLQPLPLAEAVLQQLQARQIFCAVVSNKMGDTLRLEVAHLGWEPYFNAVIGASDAPRDKPHADPLLLALQSYPHPVDDNVWFVGDSDVDLAAAAAANTLPILYGCHDEGLQPNQHFRNHPYHTHCKTHESLLSLLS